MKQKNQYFRPSLKTYQKTITDWLPMINYKKDSLEFIQSQRRMFISLKLQSTQPNKQTSNISNTIIATNEFQIVEPTQEVNKNQSALLQ